uniref:Uncharacterized protein n=1 Tax=Alexandrium andersonii TaxID=327968 RepID=A0A7S2J7Y6_9DINO
MRAHAQSNLSCSTPPGARKGRGFMLRADSESDKALHVPVENRDVSLELVVDAMDSAAAYKEHVRNAAHHILEAVGNYSEVWTDRLHLCIAACLVGTEVFCMDVTYGKNREVFSFSVQGSYPSATWAGSVAEEPWNHMPAQLQACGPKESSANWRTAPSR